MTPYARSYSGPIGLAVASVIALIVKAILESFAYLPAVSALLGTLAGFGIAIAVVWAIIVLLLSAFHRG